MSRIRLHKDNIIVSFLFLYILLIYLGIAPIGIHVVLGYSMWPSMWPGDIVLSVSTYIMKPDLGDIIVFKKDHKPIVHRIIDIRGNTIVTKGDFVTITDMPITWDDIDYVVVARVPIYVWLPAIAVLYTILFKDPRVGFTLLYLAILIVLYIHYGMFYLTTLDNVTDSIASVKPNVYMTSIKFNNKEASLSILITANNTGIESISQCNVIVNNLTFPCLNATITNIGNNRFLAKLYFTEESLVHILNNNRKGNVEFKLILTRGLRVDSKVVFIIPFVRPWIEASDWNATIHNPLPVSIDSKLTIHQYIRHTYGLNYYNTTVIEVSVPRASNVTINLPEGDLLRIVFSYSVKGTTIRGYEVVSVER